MTLRRGQIKIEKIEKLLVYKRKELLKVEQTRLILRQLKNTSKVD